jgi:hypothetical protein
VGRFLDPRHGCHRLTHDSAATISDIAGYAGRFAGLLGVLGVLFHRCGDFLHRG